MELPTPVTREVDELARRFGPTLNVVATIDDSFKDPIWKRDRYGEVCMVVRRPSGRILLSIKTFYPRGAYRLPTGGIRHGEGVYDALVRETHEETGLGTAVRRFLARITYAPLSSPGAPPVFHTFAFLLDELGGTLGALDTSERIEEWREIEIGDLPRVADVLDQLTTQGTEDIGGDWRAWGAFRAVVHRAVHKALASV
ncbi:MAG TPA: NUDIX hydrolase [Candidatus Limnocylindria bacterium]|nr:NUDIX hydrolase [Candidatus Limnocylindria bacterium]